MKHLLRHGLKKQRPCEEKLSRLGIPQDSHLQKARKIDLSGGDGHRVLMQPQQVAGDIAFHTIDTGLAHVAEQAGDLSLWLCMCSR